MSAGDAAALAAAVACAVVTVALVFALAALSRTLRTTRETVEELRREAVPLLSKLNTALDQANAELGRVDGLLDKAESIGGTVDSASRLAYLAFSNPVIKLLALGSGTARAARLLRRGRGK